MRVIIESPYKGEVEQNRIYLTRCLRDAALRGESGYASHRMLTDALNDDDQAERALGITLGFEWKEVAEKTVVYTDYGISSGMQLGIEASQKIGQPVEYRTIGPNP